MNHRVLGRSGVIVIAVAVVLCDQLSKAWITALLSDGRSIKVVPGLLDLRLVHNTGAAFSLLRGATPLLALLRRVEVIAVQEFCADPLRKHLSDQRLARP